MRARAAETGFIVRVIRTGGKQRIVILDLRTSRRLEFSSWQRAAFTLRTLAEAASAGLK